MLRRAILHPLNLLWLKFGLLLHKVVNPVLMALIFYGTVLPTGIMARLMGKDLLRLKRQPDAHNAMRGVLAGSKVDLESITRLRHAMYLDDLNQPNCPLLERALQAQIAQ